MEHPLVGGKVFPDAPIPVAVAPQSTTFVAESGHQQEEEGKGEGEGEGKGEGEEEEDYSPVLMEPVVVAPVTPPEIVQSQAQAAERLKKLKERRHVVACTFCRGRKVSPVSSPHSLLTF
jgi:hypothetical protein